MIGDCVKEHHHNLIRVYNQHHVGDHDGLRRRANFCYRVVFGAVHVASMPKLRNPRTRELSSVYPHEARIRNLTYKIESYVDV